MKNLFHFLMSISLLSILGCSENDPVSFVDGYDVDLTEDKGNVYTGNYFPLYENYTCNYSGNSSIYTKISIPGLGTNDDTSNDYIIGMIKVLPLRSIPLNSGPVMLYPVVELTQANYTVTADTSRFFMKNDQAVYIKAIKLSDGNYLEVEDPIFIKSSVVVGESWDAAPKMDMTKLLTSELSDDGVQSDMKLDAQAKFFVVGHENISLPIGNRKALRLEQASQISMNGTMYMEGYTYKINISSELSVVYHMIADTGIVHQNVTGPMNMKISAEGQSITIKIDIIQSELKLESFGDGASFNISDASASSFEIISDKKFPHSDEKMLKLANTFQNILVNKMKF